MNMAEGIKKDDLIKDGAIDSIRQDLDAMAVSLDKNDDKFKSIAKTLKSDINPTLEKTSKSIRLINEQEIKSEKLIREKLVNEEKLKKVKIAQERLSQAELRTKVANNREAERQATLKKREAVAKEKANKAAERAKKIILDESNAYKKLTKATNEAQAEFKRLAAQHGLNSKQAVSAKLKFDALDNSLRRINKEARDGRRDVGRYATAWRGAQSALGAVGITVGIGFALREGIQILDEYDEKIADIMKTTNLIKEDAKELSGDLFNIDTKTSITNLQELVVAGGRLNIKGKKDLLEFAESADKVFVALGDDLGGSADEIATSLGKISSNFGLEGEFDIAEGIEKVGSGINELSAKSKASAEPILDFTNRMAGLANVLELSDVQALGAFFDEGGQSVEIAATTMNKLLPNLAKNFEKFADVAGKTPEEFKNIAEEAPIEALKLVAIGARNNEEGLFKLTETLESFGIENARATSIVGLLTDKTERLTELQNLSSEAIDANLSLTNEFNTKNETLGATIGKATKKIKEQVIAFDEATGFTDKLKNSIAFLADNFGTILSVGGKVLRFFLVYKTAMKANQILTGKFGKSLKGLVKGLKNITKGGKRAIVTLKGIGKALKGIGFGIALELFIEAAAALYDIASGAKAAREALESLERANENAAKNVERIVNKQSELFNKRMKELDLEIRSRIANGESEEELAKEKLKREEEITNQTIKNLKRTKKFKDQALSEAIKDQQRLEQLSGLGSLTEEQVAEGKALAKKITGFEGDRAKALKLVTEKANRLTAESIALSQSIVEFNDQLAEKGVQIEEQGSSRGAGRRILAIKEETKEIENQTKAYKDLGDEIDNILDKGQSLEEIEDEEISQQNEAIQDKLTQRLTFINDAERKRTMTVEEAADARTIVELEALLKQKELLEQYGRKTFEIDQQISAKRLELSKEGAKEEITIETDKNEEIYESYRNLQEALTDVLNEQIDERIASLGKEADAAKSQQAYFEALAANGNITAQQSITEMIEIQREAEAEQARLAKVKQNIEMISAGVKTFTAAIESGDTPAQALATTLTTTQVLASILGNLNFFAKGTENAPEGWAVVDEQGAEIVTDKKGNVKDLGTSGGARFKYLDKGDKVITANKSSNLLSKFDQIGMQDTIKKSQDSAGNSYDMAIINQSIQDQTAKMDKLQTQINVDWQGLAGGMAQVNVRTNKGGDKRTERYNIR